MSGNYGVTPELNDDDFDVEEPIKSVCKYELPCGKCEKTLEPCDLHKEIENTDDRFERLVDYIAGKKNIYRENLGVINEKYNHDVYIKTKSKFEACNDILAKAMEL